MNKALTLFVLALWLSGCASNPSAAGDPKSAPSQPAVSLASDWQVTLQTHIVQPMRYAAFLDGSYGLTGGPSEAGRAQVTTDGGQTWSMAETSSECVFNLEIVDRQLAWQCSTGPVGYSLDGGRTWQAVSSYGNYCRQLSFLDAKTGWLAGVKEIASTVDGGQSWQPLQMPAGMQEIAAIALRSPTDGAMLDIGGALYLTSDGGATWAKGSLGLELGSGKLPEPETAAAAVRFLDEGRGLAVGHILDDAHSQLVLLRTSDGGQTWSRQPLLDTPIQTAVYLSHDGNTLTVVDTANSQVTLMQYEGGK